MTEHGHNFIREIAEAYRALEQEPERVEQIARLEKQHIADGDRIAQLEMRLIDRSNAIDELNAKLRSVEAERDDAGFRLLETEDRLDGIKRLLGIPEAIASAVAKREQEVRAELAPKVVEATYEVVPSAPPPTPAQGDQTGTGTESGALSSEPLHDQSPGHAGMVGESIPDGQGPSATDPTPQNASSEVGQGSPVEPVPGKYSGKRYHDWDYYVPLSAWLAGGGTEADYHWRPQAKTAW